MSDNNPKPSNPNKPQTPTETAPPNTSSTTSTTSATTSGTASSSTTETVWTIMLYLAGDNNLADECVYALTQVKEVDTDKRVRVVAQFDPTGRKVRTRRFTINKAVKEGQPEKKDLIQGQHYKGWKDRRKIIEDALDDSNPLPVPTVVFPGEDKRAALAVKPGDIVETDSGDPKFLFDFISWAVENFPADHYMVVLSGHGGGATEQEFLFDETTKGTLTIKEMGIVFQAVKDHLKNKQGEPLLIDIVGMDSCLMSMAEVAHELRGSVKFMISSESFGPQSGWPYGQIIERLNEHLNASGGKTSAEDLARITVDEHVDFYVEYSVTNGLSVDISMMDLSQVNNLADKVAKLGEVLTGELRLGKSARDNGRPSDFLDQIVLAHWEAQSYNGEVYVDLRDFCDCLRTRYSPAKITVAPGADPNSPEVKEKARREAVGKACGDVITAVDSLVKQSCFMGVQFQYSFGVSIYLPWAEVSADYNEDELSWVTATGWKKFLDEYVRCTRRLPRNFAPNQREVIGLDPVRKTVTDQKGPSNILIRSMRNPPIDVVESGLSDCTQKRLAAIPDASVK